MKPQEIRIGNITSHGVVEEINNDDSPHFCVVDAEGRYWDNKANEINPITITEEWLLRFGFWKDDRCQGPLFIITNLLDKNHRFLGVNLIQDGLVTFHHSSDYQEMGVIRHIEFVHQLQNLYFALTGEELELK